jgi:hypothetical protein
MKVGQDVRSRSPDADLLRAPKRSKGNGETKVVDISKTTNSTKSLGFSITDRKPECLDGTQTLDTDVSAACSGTTSAVSADTTTEAANCGTLHGIKPSPVPNRETPPSEPQGSKHCGQTIDDLRIFNKEVSDEVSKRFEHVRNQVEPALLLHLRKKRVEFRPLGMQLLVLGLAEDVAKPWVVVLCPENARTHVKRFFDDAFIRNICQGPKSCPVRFDTLVCARPLRPANGETFDQVYVDPQALQDLETWNPRLRAIQMGQAHYATMGGFVCVVDAQGDESFYGLTAGHILSPDDLYGEDAERSPSDSEDDGYELTSESDTLSDTASSYAEQEQSIPEAGTAGFSLGFDDKNWPFLGNMSPASYSERARNRDWALVELTASLQGQSETPKSKTMSAWQVACPTNAPSALKIANRSATHCTISKLPARAILPCGRDFVDVHVLHILGSEGMYKCLGFRMLLTLSSTFAWFLWIMGHRLRTDSS